MCEFKFDFGNIVFINEQIMIVEITGHLTSLEGSARTWDRMPLIRDIPYYTGWLATLVE